jgi:hypothetical protein
VNSPNFNSSASSVGTRDVSNIPKLVHSTSFLRTLVINFQSLWSKKAEFETLLEVAEPDIVLGTETWLKPENFSSEFFPTSYNVYRKDRPGGYGGALVAVRSGLISHEIYHNSPAVAVLV